MKITAVEVVLVDLPPQPLYAWRQGIPGSDGPVTGAQLLIHTDEGITGRADTRRGPIVRDIVDRRIRDEILGADPLARELLWHRVWELSRVEQFPLYALGLVDVALWDIAAQCANVPLHVLLGRYREAIPAYASTVTYSSIEEYLDIADQCLEAGYTAIKLHAFGDARLDAELSIRLREHVGDDVPLMYDGSAAFDLADAVYLGRALGDAGFLWYEEPISEFSVSSYEWLAQKISVPLLVAETNDGAHYAAADFIRSGSAQYVRTSAIFKGGITGAMRIAHLADSFNLRAEVHGGGLLSQHLCMAISNTTYYESLVFDNPIARDPFVGPDGMVHAPTAIGVGWDSVPQPSGAAAPVA
jgi:L-alanine-DL-glutamate epimerase-like enolase superfamily enzyme